MSTLKLTKSAEKAFRNAQKRALENSNSHIEPEHLVYEILKLNNIALSKLLTNEEKNTALQSLEFEINNLPKLSPKPSVINPSQILSYIITSTDKGNYVSADQLFYNCLELEKIQRLFPKNLKEKLENSMVKNVDTYNEDDVEEKTSKFAIELVEQARKGLLDPVIGRENEIRLAMEILCKKSKSNVMLVGPPGVGKTALVNGLAQLIAEDKAPVLKNSKIYSVDIGSMVAGSGVRGEFEERLKSVIKEAESQPGTILFIDEIHTVLSAGKTDGALDAANMLKPALAGGSIKMIGSTTFDEYRRYIEKDPAFARRFVKINVTEPSIEDAVTMLRGLKGKLETHHGTKISDSAIVFAVKQGKKYIPNRRLPDVAIDLVDTACSSAVINLESEPQEVLKLKNKIWSTELEKATLEQDLQRKKEFTVQNRLDEVNKKIVQLKDELTPLEESFKKDKSKVNEAKQLKKKLENCELKIAKAQREKDYYTASDIQNNVIPHILNKLKEIETSEIITSEHVANIISRWTNIPVTRLNLKENERLLEMDSRLKQRIFGQNEAVESIVESILQNRVGLSQKNKPIGSFLFLGPTGVGKTELAKALSYELFDDERSMVFLDMSDYANEISLTKFVGASAGYVGYGEGGTLTEPIKNKPYNVILLDEVDLAHKLVLNVLYQLMEEGRVVDGKGNEIDFTNTVLIMTSNLGQEILLKEYLDEKDKTLLEKMVVDKFGPAFFNRIDKIIHFSPLRKEVLVEILNYQLYLLNERLRDKNITFVLSERAKEEVIYKNHSPFYGARPLKRYVQAVFVSAITRLLLMTNKREEDRVIIECCLRDEEMNGSEIGDFVYKWVVK
ncbi:hypothetical protein H312_02736 [Anncaliia algerae PRA339]|uniref:ATP-dependent chaperone ClpB n=1 Tax=Anncaliia algerae PRA339 TaxID=1288291 RepID=A0A059EY66_9MICR|nr:hypothetical protein H312_02736 [Anncaliia algerae PRA339]